MFGLNCRRIYKVLDTTLVRSLRGGRLGPSGSGPNPGLDKRIVAFEEEGIKLKDDDIEEFVEQSDSDFLNSGVAYNKHLNESLMGKYVLRHQIVKEKYFKENMPNLLTWSEKEQIRHLHSENPDEWTVEKIAESFPVTAAVTKKLLKYPWKPATELRISRHDESALRNWKELKDGTLDIPDELRQHFLKFSNRTIPPLQKKSLKIDVTQEKIGEFQRIIDKFAAKEHSKKEQRKESDQNMNYSPKKENLNSKIDSQDKSKITLEELTKKIKKRMDSGNIDMPDQIIVSTINSTVSSPSADIPVELDTTEENSMTHFKESDNKVAEVATYPERIRIPKKAYKRGATFKVNDCYYDDDGRFLYRVIGVTN